MSVVDATALARALLEPIPAHRTFGLEVVRAADGAATMALSTPPAMTNVIGSLHSSGLVALVDACGLAAIISASTHESDFEGVVPLGATASLEFRAPARGRLTATCTLDAETLLVLRTVLSRQEDRARVCTSVDVTDEAGSLVCRGRFDWSVRRVPAGT